jgi:hypothetical protein
VSLYVSEQALVEEFLERLTAYSPWGDLNTGSEFFYQRGRTDVIAVDEGGSVIAFEAKLTKWKDALQQAYRNTCFAHLSYVILPKKTALLAYRHTDAFSRRGIGICYVDRDTDQETVVILHDAEEAHPLQPWLSDRARSFVNKAVEGSVAG